MARIGSARPGLTLVEFLVVLGAMGMLVALLLPAVQRARAAAARIQCCNRLKQIGLALHSYHDSHGCLPPGVSSWRPRDKYPRMSWHARILPYLEYQSLWDVTVAAYDYQPYPFADPPHVGLGTPLAAFACPADDRALEPQATHNGRQVAVTSYVGLNGTAYDRRDGVFFVDSRVRLIDIKDGTSCTLMVGERPPSPDFWYGWWYAGHGQGGSGSPDMLLGARERNIGGAYISGCPPGPYHFQPGRPDEQSDVFHFWSLHAGGANFLLADGSVHFMTYDADDLLPALATRAGGENAQVP